jgi:hypothetical protein
MASLSKQQEKLRQESEQYQRRITLAPLWEKQQLTDILRDDDLYKKDYSDLLNKDLQAEMITSFGGKAAGPAVPACGSPQSAAETP